MTQQNPAARTTLMDAPLPIPLTDWIHLRSHLKTASVVYGHRKKLWRPEVNYLVTAWGAITLLQDRQTDWPFGLYIPQGMLWPLDAYQLMWFEAHTVEGRMVGWLSVRALQEAMQFSAELRTFCIQAIITAHEHLSDELYHYMETGAAGRLAYQLLVLDKSADAGPVRCSHELLANMLNMRRESVSHILANFEQAGFLHRGYRHIQLVDRKGLYRLSQRVV